MISKSFPHYPHKKVWKLGKFKVNKRTNVLWSYDKNSILSKKIGKRIDF